MRQHLRVLKAPLALLGVTVAIGLVLASNAEKPFERPPPPAPVGAYRDGGVPERDAGIEAALARLPGTLPGRDDPAFASRPAVAKAWRGLVDSVRRFPETGLSDPRIGDWMRELRAHAAATSDQLAAERLGYYVDVQLDTTDGVTRPIVIGYRIDEITFVRAGDRHQRVLDARRLDAVRVAQLGVTSEELDDPVVLLDQVDAKVEEQVMPVLRGYAYPIGDSSWAHSARGRQVMRSAATAIRRELAFALGTDLADPTPRCRRLVAESVRHHEAQHGLDRERDRPAPRALGAYLHESLDSPFARQTGYEVSAYLSQIASDIWLPQLVLWNLSRHAFRHQSQPLAESYAAVVVIERLARHFNISVPPLLVVRGVVDRDRLASVVMPLAEIPTLELRSAAAEVWAELYGEKLARIVDELPGA